MTERHRQKRVAAKPVLAVWIGDDGQRPRRSTRPAFRYATEASAIAGFMHLVRYVEETRDC